MRDHDELGAWNRARIPVLAACVALLLQVLYILSLGPEALQSLERIRDSLYYDLRAEQIASGHLLGNTAEYLSPLYCLALGLMKLAGLESPPAMRLGQTVIVALSVALVAWLGQRYFSPLAGLIAGVGYALYPASTYYGAEILPTSLVVLVNLLALALYPDPAARHSGLRLALCGMAVGLASLAKANALLLLPLLAAGHVLATPREGRPGAWRGAGLLLAGAAITIAPITVKNVLVTKRFVLITTSGGVNLLKGNGPRATGTHVFLERRPWNKGAGLKAHLQGAAAQFPTNVVTISRRVGDRAVAFMRRNPKRTLRLFARKFYFFWHDREFVVRDNLPEARRKSALLAYPYPSYGLLVAMAAFALPLILWRRELWPLFGLLGVQAASFTLVFVLARYRMVAAALLFIVFSGGIVRLRQHLRDRALGRVVAACALGVAVAGATLLPLDPPNAPPSDDGAPAPEERVYP